MTSAWIFVALALLFIYEYVVTPVASVLSVGNPFWLSIGWCKRSCWKTG